MPAATLIVPGQRFGHWTVIKEAERSGKNREVMVRCDCGTVAARRPSILASGRSPHCKSCGMVVRWKASRNNYLGKSWGQFTVVRFDGMIGEHRAYIIRCSCGFEERVRSNYIWKGMQEGTPKKCRACMLRELHERREKREGAIAEERHRRRLENPHPRRRVQIDPDIEAMPVSRQRRLQIQLRRNGCCIKCGVPTEHTRCERCYGKPYSKKHLSPEDKEAVLALHRAGKSGVYIARLYEVTPPVIYQFLKRQRDK